MSAMPVADQLSLPRLKMPVLLCCLLLANFSGCAYPGIVESVRSGPLPQIERTEILDVTEELMSRFPIGSETSRAVEQLKRAGFKMKDTFPQPYLKNNDLDIAWRGGRVFRKGMAKYMYLVNIDSKNSKIRAVKGIVKKFFF